MCRRSEYDLYARASSKPARTNFEPTHFLWRCCAICSDRACRSGAGGSVPFPVEVATRTDTAADREGSKA